MMRYMLSIRVGDDPVSFVDEPRSIIFDLVYNEAYEKKVGSLEMSDIFNGEEDETWISYELKIEGIEKVEFERKGEIVTIVITRTQSQPETITFTSKIFEVWFPSPNEGSHALTVVTLKSISHGARFVATVMPKKNYYCDIEATHVS